jgi:alpha-ribazole phosphatase
MKTELWLVRHGQTDWNQEKRYQGQTDIPLNEIGLQQAAGLSESLENTQFDAIYCSDLQRARQTANVLAIHLNLPVFQDRRMREASFGEWEGQIYPEIKLRYPEVWEERKINPKAAVAPGGETMPQVARRMCRAADAITAAFPGGRVLVVSHGLALAVLVCQSEGRPLNEAYRYIMDNAHPVVLKWESVGETIHGDS